MFSKSLKELYKYFKTDESGLSEVEANTRLAKYGKNALVEAKKKSKLKIFFNQFNDMMIIILIIVAIMMAIYGFFYSHEYTDTIVIVVVVLINAIMGFIQEEKAEVTLEGLKKYSITKVRVCRKGKIKVIDSAYLVPGDIIILEAGDKVPADARIIKESNVFVDEAALTGESLPVQKSASTLKVSKAQIQDQTNMLFSGSSITNGRVVALVVKTGMDTELGRIATSLNTPYEIETPLQLKIKEISKKLTILIFIILIFIFIYGVYKDYAILEIVMLCVSLAVAAIPEGLPAVITITLSAGAGVLARKNTIVRQMTAVETLGSTDIICSDKTGTITQNKMTVTHEEIEDKEMFINIALLANDTTITDSNFIGDPTETCLYEYLKNEIAIEEFREKYPRIIDAPFDSVRKMMSSVNNINGKNYILVKGSLENLLNACTYKVSKGKKVKLTKLTIEEIRNSEKKMAEKSLRVIGFAYKELKSIPKTSKSVLKEESELVYVGSVGIIDPPRESVKSSVQKCLDAGIRPIMITGDSLDTACAIAKSVGIIKNKKEGILGADLDQYTDEELVKIVENYNVYARVSPEHKLRIVNAWQSRGKVVAMTGDGVNDAPAIKDAHVGVGMGITGTEVTKSVADIILLDDSFSTIVVAVEEGRRIFSNIRNNVVYSLSSNFAEIFTVLIGMLTGHTILIPIHILFIDLVTDSIPSICLSFEKAEKDVMKKEPRGIDKPIFTPFVYGSIISSAVVETIFVLITYFVGLRHFSNEIAGSLALLSLVIQEIIYAVVCRNLKELVTKQGIFSNKAMNFGLLIVIIIELLVFATPLGSIISVEVLPMSILLKVVLFNSISFIIYELSKLIFKKVLRD